jgi:protein CpxP
MTSMFKPLKSVNTLVLAGIMAAASLAAVAQTATPGAPATATAPAQAGPHAGHHGKHRHDPAKMQARIAKHQAELKAKPAQEAAWSAYTAALQPQARPAGQRPDRAAMRAEFEKLTTPQRIDKMNALRAQRMAEMNAKMTQRGEATKTFYAALNADQQKVFDSQRMAHGGKGHGGRHGHHKG